MSQIIYCKYGLVLLLLNFYWVSDVKAADYEYPELMVTPRASERLQMEANKENQNRWLVHLPIQTSAAATLVAGLIQSSGHDPGKDSGDQSKMAGITVGAGWLVTSTLLAAFYSPYSSNVQETGVSGKSPREQLIKERLAEEHLDSVARLSCRLTYLSVLTNLGASVYMAANATSGSTAFTADLVAAAVSFAPVIFMSRWQAVTHEQHEYKKKIYAPIAANTLVVDQMGKTVAPGLSLSFAF